MQRIKGGGLLAQTREDKIQEEMESPIQLDLNVEFRIPRSNQTTEKKYKCSCCGASWDNQKSHFSKSADVLWQSNDGYLPICNSCRDTYYYKLVDFYGGNESHAIKHFCMQFGWVFDIEGLKAAKQISADRSRISHYGAKKNLGQVANIGKTYFDYMKYHYLNKQDEVISSKEDAKSKDVAVTGTAIDRWGADLKPWDYEVLESHHKILKKNNPNADNNQEIFIKSLCNINWLMSKMLRTENVDASKYTSLVEQYSKTFKQAGLRTIEEKDSSNDETFSMTLGFFSEFTPEEFYLNKKLYEDMDGFGEYLERHVTRPMITLETGSETRDFEYF